MIGGGIAGMNAALSLAKQGTKVTIIEQSPSIGGHMAKIGKVFSPVKIAEECGMCLLNPILNEVVWNENIEIITNAKVVEAERRAGTYNLIVEKSPRYVDTENVLHAETVRKFVKWKFPMIGMTDYLIEKLFIVLLDSPILKHML